MCGIIAFLGAYPGYGISYDGIRILQNRGYDSCGVAGIGKDGKIVCHKWASTESKTGVEAVGDVAQHHSNDRALIFHTRWATTGHICDANAHPHLDNKRQIAVVHNGIIENYHALKTFLRNEGYRFCSETDTEVIPVLIEYFLDQGLPFIQALRQALDRIEGTWGLAILYEGTPNTLYLCKRGSPLIVGTAPNFVLVASESSAVLNHVKNYFVLEDNDIIEISIDAEETISIIHNTKVVTEPCQYFECRSTVDELEQRNINCKMIALTPDPYPHWMLKEILEQPESLNRTLNLGGRLLNECQVHLGGLKNHRDDLLRIKNLLLLGCGTSLNAARLGVKYFKMLQCFDSVQAIDASEFNIKDLPRPLNSVGILVLTQSGETKDVHRAMELAKDEGIFIFSIVNVVGSLIAREAACGIYLNAGREVAVASTKSFTSQCLALSLIAIWYAEQNENTKQKRREFINCIRNLPSHCQDVLNNLSERLAKVVEYLTDYEGSMFILGRDLGEPIAAEAALKIKEVTYLHAEGYPAGCLKHGPFALIQPGTPIILLTLDDENAGKMELAAEEVKTRGAYNILITNQSAENIKTHLYNHVVQIPNNKIFGSMLAILPLQMLAYQLAIAKGYNPDYPRNLAKVVTVDG